ADGGRCLGLAWAKLWVRRGKITTGRRQRPMAAKEAQRWQDGITAAETVLAGAELVTVVGDREADIYQSWARPRPANLHPLARERGSPCRRRPRMRPVFWPRAAVALAVADHARRQHRGRGPADRQMVSPALEHRAAVLDPQAPGPRCRGQSSRDRRRLEQTRLSCHPR